MTSALVPAPTRSVGDPEADRIADRLTAVRSVLAPDLNDQELGLFAMVAARSGLDPFAKQLYAVKRSGRVTFQTGIDGYRSTAERTGEYDGSDEPEYGPTIEQPFAHPEWARVTVYRWRHGRRVGQPATAYWAEFYPGQGQDAMWRKMPRNQLAKCAEALAMRKAFPFVLADIYTPEEMDQAGPGDNAQMVAAAKLPTAAERIAARRAAIETPAAASQTVQEPPQVEDGTFTPEPEPAPAVASLCGSHSPLDDGVTCGVAADVRHGICKQLVDGRVVSTWQRPAA